MTFPVPFQQISDDFEFLDDWEERYKYIIDLGRQLPDMPEQDKTEATRVRGCASQVWLTTRTDDGVFRFAGDSDALIVRGLIAVLFSIYNDKTAQQILDTDAAGAFSQLGLKEHLTAQRSNGFSSMVARIRTDATTQLAGETNS